MLKGKQRRPRPKMCNICHCTNGRIEAPKAPRVVVCGEGVFPSPPGVGSGDGAVPPLQEFFWISDI